MFNANFIMTTISTKIATKYHKIFNLTLRNFSIKYSTNNTFKKSNYKLFNENLYKTALILKNDFGVDTTLSGSGARAETTSTTQGLNKLQAQELILRLNSEERIILFSAIQEYQSKVIKDEYQGQLAASKWRSKFGRPAKLPKLGDVDPTGSYCALPEDWLMKKCVESVPPPTMKTLIDIAIANSIPFVGFGFLDNFFMILFGDYIDWYLGSYFCLSTMAAAALGNTFSDVMGIGSAFYVERLANRIGYIPPKLSPIQMEMPVSRRFANIGRVLGVTIGCLLGMFPLMFKKSSKKEDEPVKVQDAQNKTK